jgi:hypothetical protein
MITAIVDCQRVTSAWLGGRPEESRRRGGRQWFVVPPSGGARFLAHPASPPVFSTDTSLAPHYARFFGGLRKLHSSNPLAPNMTSSGTVGIGFSGMPSLPRNMEIS